MSRSFVFKVDEERASQVRPPVLSGVPAGSSGNIVIEKLDGVSRFDVFGHRKVMAPRQVTLMSRIDGVKIKDAVLSSGMLEERRLTVIGSTHPEEIQRYWSYAKLSRGDVLVFGAGLGLFVEMASWKSLLVIEPNPNIYRLVHKWFFGQKFISAGWLGQEAFPEHDDRKYHFIFLDPNPYVGRGASNHGTEALLELNQLALKARKLLASGGFVTVKGYADLVKRYQEECQIVVSNFWMYHERTSYSPMIELFVKWALRNRKRVLEKKDWKFINAWSGHTATTVT